MDHFAFMCLYHHISTLFKGMYIEKKSISGEHADELSYHNYLRDFKGVKWRPPLSNHCLILPHEPVTTANDDSFSSYY